MTDSSGTSSLLIPSSRRWRPYPEFQGQVAVTAENEGPAHAFIKVRDARREPRLATSRRTIGDHEPNHRAGCSRSRQLRPGEVPLSIDISLPLIEGRPS